MVSGFEKFAGLNGIETSLVAADCGSIKANAPANANSAALVRIIKLLGWICTVRGACRSAVARQTRQRLLCSDSSAAWAVFGSYPHVRNGSKAFSYCPALLKRPALLGHRGRMSMRPPVLGNRERLCRAQA